MHLTTLIWPNEQFDINVDYLEPLGIDNVCLKELFKFTFYNKDYGVLFAAKFTNI